MPQRPLTPEDVIAFRKLDDAQISPEGQLVALVLGDHFKLDTKWPRSVIWVVDTCGSESRQLTTGRPYRFAPPLVA